MALVKDNEGNVSHAGSVLPSAEQVPNKRQALQAYYAVKAESDKGMLPKQSDWDILYRFIMTR